MVGDELHGRRSFVARWPTSDVANGVYKLQARYRLDLTQAASESDYRVTAVTDQVMNENP